ncbi:hypothetical protein [Rhizobium phaseoli]|uniref:hypothetical protein n=1 Tax=Rhizobium phaseoli TaxID=396 RepID=UPI0007F0A812|nr:hypothetical protein [Rhizobium phaseoli]ANL42408.1 hypothetical protein AMC88_CH04075 [Rhizobium phaseoli]ANL61394.1 hypothetical protein AMC85_CH04072 [Rhizobium phaseoli]
MREILEALRVEGRNGTMVAIEGSTDLPIGSRLIAGLHVPGNEVREVAAYKDWLHPSPSKESSTEGFLLVGSDKSEIKDGTMVEISSHTPASH